VVGLDDKVFLNMTTTYLPAYTMPKVKCPVDAEILRFSFRVTQRKRNEKWPNFRNVSKVKRKAVHKLRGRN
jgi:hypothetical protein